MGFHGFPPAETPSTRGRRPAPAGDDRQTGPRWSRGVADVAVHEVTEPLLHEEHDVDVLVDTMHRRVVENSALNVKPSAVKNALDAGGP
jgi:hypothetical protein